MNSTIDIRQHPKSIDVVKAETSEDNFLKFGSLSPDGSQLLCLAEHNSVSMYHINADWLGKYKYYDPIDSETEGSAMSEGMSINVGDSIYDAKWYPFMNTQDVNTMCFIATSRDHPISLWDCSSGKVRASYSGINHLDELEPAVSLSFNCTGDKIYAGSNRMIRCFDLSEPGKNSFAIPTTKNRKAVLGQKGLISTLSFNPDCSGLYAAGSFANSIGMYVENDKECAMQLDQLDFGVTHMKWSPCGRYLWAGGRHHSSIQCWDIRSTGSCVGQVTRSLHSQQRMVFDIDPWGAILATGSDEGRIRAFDTTTFELLSDFDAGTSGGCVNTVLFHPYCSLMLGVNGERSFGGVGEEPDDDSDEDTDTNAQEKEPRKQQSGVCLWELFKRKTEEEAAAEMSIVE